MQKIITGDCLEVMKTFPDNHFTSIITDSPYGISFMSKKWDQKIPSCDYWQQMIRVIKPGGHLLAAGLPRMFHRLAVVIEDSGWEIRDILMHLFGSGFPKSHNNFGFKGYGTALKPAWEGWILAMKPLDGTFAQNAEKWGVSGLNIDDCRIPTHEKLSIGSGNVGYEGGYTNYNPLPQNEKGRWPANLILDKEAGAELDRMSGIAASRFFYCPKASSSERNKGLEGMPLKDANKIGHFNEPGNNGASKNSSPMANSHPTVKPIALMEYLIKLIMPPKDGLILDPFSGSGTTIIAAKKLGYSAIGIEKESEYAEIAEKRLQAYQTESEQLSLF